MRMIYVLAAATLATGCAMNPAPVPVIADPAGEALVLGDWSGSYYAAEGGRAGSIVFQFHRHEGTALQCNGDVLMAAPARQYMQTDEERAAGPVDQVRILAIDELRVTGAVVTGRMAPYNDPETGEALSTTFEGRVAGDVIKGSLTTYHARSGASTTGAWEVRRDKNP